MLFADLAGFTSRSEQLDVEDVQGFLDPYQQMLRRQVESKGGMVAKSTGDGVMALFGALVAHEDDAERAVRCAIAIRDAMTQESEDDLHVRVGVTTGEALVSHGAGGDVDAIGDVVNTAARLESAAPTDGVLVDEFTYRATSRAIRYEELEPVAVKGKSERVPVWQALEPRSIVPEQARLGGLPLVGRDAEAHMLRHALERSRREPSTQLVTIIGEPGIGKTRLVEELREYVESIPELLTWRRGRSLSYGEGIAFWALGEMVKSQAGILESDEAAVAEAKLAEAADAVLVDERVRDWVVRRLRALVGLETAMPTAGEGGRGEAFGAWRRFFEALAEEGPTVLVFEDLHWADDALLDFVDLLADRAGAVPLLIVCTARPELLERRQHWGGGKTNATTISLTPLSPDDTARLVGELLHQPLLPAEVQQALLERAEGNPLYAQEYVRMLQDRGLLAQGDGGWALTGRVEGLPESIHGIIAARLDTLTADERGLLQDAAVVGRTAWLGAVQALTERSAWAAEELLYGLERKQLLQRVRRSSVQGETEFAFAHSLTRDVAYAQIQRADRAAKHEAAAAWIERLGSGREDKSELLADHYQHALTLRRQLGEDTTSLVPRALEAFTEAARQAEALHAYGAAARLYHAALELTPAAAIRERARLLHGEARVLHHAGVAEEQTLTTARDAQVAIEDWEAAADSELMLGRWYETVAGDGADADARFAQSAEYAARVPPSDAMCVTASQQAFRMILAGRSQEALELTERMLRLAAESGLEIGHAGLLRWHGDARHTLGDPSGIDDMTVAAEVLAASADPQTPSAWGNLGEAMRSLGRLDDADRAFATADEWTNRLGAARFVDWLTVARARAAYQRGDWATATELIARVDTNDRLDDVDMRSIRGRLSLGRGRDGDALADADSTAEYGVSSNNDDMLLLGRALAVMCHAAAGREREALAACEQILERWRETSGYTNCAPELCEIAPVLAQRGRHEDIRRAALLLPAACGWRDVLLLMADARPDAAAAAYERIGHLPLAADAQLLAAAEAARRGDSATAHRHAAQVRAFADRAGAPLYSQRADELLRAIA